MAVGYRDESEIMPPHERAGVMAKVKHQRAPGMTFAAPKVEENDQE